MKSGAYTVVRIILYASMAVLGVLAAAMLITYAMDPYAETKMFALYPFVIAAAVFIELILWQCTAVIRNSAAGRGVSLDSARHLHRMEQFLGLLGMAAALVIPVAVAFDLTNKVIISVAALAVLAVTVIVTVRIDRIMKAVLAKFHAEDYFDKKEDTKR
ncbi:MAG: hypothetical protein ACOX74_03305 [Lachnospiraceae bacterium]